MSQPVRWISLLCFAVVILMGGNPSMGQQTPDVVGQSASTPAIAGAGQSASGDNPALQAPSTAANSAPSASQGAEVHEHDHEHEPGHVHGDPAGALSEEAMLEEPPEEYKRELQARIDLFRSKRKELEKAIGDQREIYVRYLNREEYSPERRQAFYDQRDKVRVLLDEAFLAALSILQIGFDEEAATYLATIVQHRHERDIYDAATMEGAARLIDGGSELKFLFEAAARSSIVCGEFDMAEKIYSVMVDENQEEVDNRLEFNLERYREEFLKEAEYRTKEIQEDRLPRVLFKTTQGDVVVELFIDQAPSTVSHFIRLVEEGFYNGLDFFQVIDHLLALTGDPSGTGTGNSGKYLKDEHVRPDARKGLRGSLVMAKIPIPGSEAGEFIPNSGSSQFAILLLPVLSASEQQTIFGTVIEGMDAVSRMRRVDPYKEKNEGEIVYPSDSILEASVIRRPDVLPEPEYVGP